MKKSPKPKGWERWPKPYQIAWNALDEMDRDLTKYRDKCDKSMQKAIKAIKSLKDNA